MRKLLLIFTVMVISLNYNFADQNKPLLRSFGKNVYSQWGEDGIIEKIFEVIGVQSKNSIEFGAADGLYFSNTANLWKNKNWKSILIECNPKYQHDLICNTQSYKCMAVFKKVGFSQNDCLETLLSEIGFNEPVDLLSIDIDGNDYYILQSLTWLKPRVIICEYNPTFPADLDIVSPPNNFSGSSVTALSRVAKNKGYSLVAITDTNCFFVRDSEVYKLKNFETSLESMRINKYLKYIITDFAGKYKVIGEKDSKTPFGLKAFCSEEWNGNIYVYDDVQVQKIH